MDEVTRNAKDIHHSDEVGEAASKYILGTIKPMAKKIAEKDTASQAMMAHTYSIALQVVSRLDGIPFYEIAMGVFVYCKDEACRFISKDFEAAIELAGAAPEKFILTLHKFYNNISAKLRKPAMLIAFAQFVHTFMRLRYTKSGKGINPNIILAYTDLILNTLYYLHPNKLDYSVDVVGISIDGRPLTVETPYGLVPLCEFRYIVAKMAGNKISAEEIFAKEGIQLPKGGVEEIYRRVRLRENISGNLLPFLNEYTFDIYPTNWPRELNELFLVKVDVDIADVKAKLKKRRRPLPSNGVKVEFDDPAEIFKHLIIKEIVMYDQVYMLYRLVTDIGDFSGYFATESGFFYCLNEQKSDEIINVIAGTVLYFYAGATLDEGYEPENFKNIAYNLFWAIDAHCYGVGGPLRNAYDKQPSQSGVRKADARFAQKDVLINAAIRQLPAGQKASQQAIENARRLGYTLAPGETFVMPFIKRVFYLKDDEPNKRDDEREK